MCLFMPDAIAQCLDSCHWGRGIKWMNKLFIKSRGFSLYPPIILLFKGLNPHVHMLTNTYKRIASTPLTHTHTCEHLFTLSHPIPQNTHHTRHCFHGDRLHPVKCGISSSSHIFSLELPLFFVLFLMASFVLSLYFGLLHW